MKATEFKVATRSDAEEFDQLLNRYRLEHHIHKWPFISLEEFFNISEEHEKPAQLFSAFFDICLQDVALQCDLKIIRDETNREYSGGDIEGFFSLRMGRYIAASNAALRFRAMWDKIMGLTVLVHWPNKYQDFFKAKSRLKAFQKIARGWKIDPGEEQNESIEEWNKKWEQSINQIERIVRGIDDNFRTAEAHSIGRIGKWAFTKQKGEDDPFEELLLASNDIYERLRDLSFILRVRRVRNRDKKHNKEVNEAKSCGGIDSM
ncbi:hypothetical protein ACKFKF_20155 [Phormidesmis sp. 146-12]